jgi:hypothetical protein
MFEELDELVKIGYEFSLLTYFTTSEDIGANSLKTDKVQESLAKQALSCPDSFFAVCTDLSKKATSIELFALFQIHFGFPKEDHHYFFGADTA